MRAEIILGLLATIKSKISSEIYGEKKKAKPDQTFLKEQEEKLIKLEEVLNRFYGSRGISDDEFDALIGEIRGEVLP